MNDLRILDDLFEKHNVEIHFELFKRSNIVWINNEIQGDYMLLLLLLLGVDVYHLGMSLSRPLSAPSTTVLSLAMSLATTRHAAT